MFLQNSEQLFAKLSDHAIMCLATSQNNIVTARSISVIIYEQKFYFQSDINFLKYQQIKVNPNVALCYNNVQIEGVCKAIGHPLFPENNFFTNLYKQHYKGSFEKYSGLKDEMLFEIMPSKISVWDYEDEKPYQEFYNFHDKSYCKEYYTI